MELNRIYAFAKVFGNREAIVEAEKLAPWSNQYYSLLLGVLYREINRDKAMDYFQEALKITNSAAERSFIRKNYLEK